MSRTIFRFADFQLDPAARELRHGSERVALPPKSLECLVYLVQQRERAVGRDELISAVWGRVDVSDALLAQTLLRARRAVGDTGNEQSSIRTVPRFGYQWVAPTQVLQVAAEPILDSHQSPATPAAPESGSTSPQGLGSPGLKSPDTDEILDTRRTAANPEIPDSHLATTPPARRRLWLLAAIATAVVLAGLAWLLLPASAPRREAGAAASPNLLVVAPVQLLDGSGDQAWIRLGVMDYIAARLRKAGLAVLPSERVAGLVAEGSGESLRQLHQRLREASGASRLLQPSAGLRGDGSWQLRLQLIDADTAHEFDAESASPLAAADGAVTALLRQLGRGDASTPPPADAAAERLQRLDAALLEGDLAAARALIAAADPAAHADPALRVREGQVAFRVGELEQAQATFDALLAGPLALPPELQSQALMGLGALAVRRGLYADAERRYAEALAVLGPDGRQDLTGNGFSGRGVARAAQGHQALAAADLARARVALERAGDAPGVASVDTNLGLLQSRSGQSVQALQSFERAIAVFQRYGVRDSLAASLLGKARAQLQLLDNEASLATSREAQRLAQTLENPVLRRNIAQQLAAALTTAGQLGEATTVLAQAPTASAPGDGIALATAQLALQQNQPERALDALAALAADDAEALWLRVCAAQALGEKLDPALRQQLAEAIPAAAAKANAASASLLAQALWLDLGGDRNAAASAFAAALAKADAEGDTSRRVDVLAAWLAMLLRQGELDRATELAGQLAPVMTRDYRAARAAAQYYRAVGDASLQAAAEERVRALAGERSTTLP